MNYRNDSEPNDGLGGSYGTGSTISRVWVEHTKTGAWIVNSSGLVVDCCRFRDTIADGINLCVGMQSTTVTNCTTRGTGDDCFAIWPATYTGQTYTPGLNVITHCTGQTPFLANGGAIYGGASNCIEDCQFQDITYGCGILISTTFPVGANTFSGTTVAQRCDLIRCGGYDPGYQWRAALQLCLDTYSGGISGVNLNNLNITNSISDGMSVIGGTGTLTNAVAAGVSIPNYGIGTSGRNGLWARNDAVGSMTVSNSTIVEYRDDSSKFSFIFVTNNAMSVMVQANPPGLSFTVDGTNYTSAQTFNWTPGSNHTIATTSPQSGGTGVQYAWSAWSDGGAMAHIIAPDHQFHLHGQLHDAVLPDNERGCGRKRESGELVDEQRYGGEHQRHGVQRLQFHWLDGQRHRVVFGKQQRGFNYHERTDYPDRQLHHAGAGDGLCATAGQCAPGRNHRSGNPGASVRYQRPGAVRRHDCTLAWQRHGNPGWHADSFH